MTALDLAARLVREHEGCRLEAYRDQAGRWTIGYGHAGPEVRAGLSWTEDQADAGLRMDLDAAAEGVKRLGQVPLSGRQTAALVSLLFNVGARALEGSILIELVNQRRWIEAAKEWLHYDHVEGPESRGLLIRRMDEAVLFLKGS